MGCGCVKYIEEPKELIKETPLQKPIPLQTQRSNKIKNNLVSEQIRKRKISVQKQRSNNSNISRYSNKIEISQNEGSGQSSKLTHLKRENSLNRSQNNQKSQRIIVQDKINVYQSCTNNPRGQRPDKALSAHTSDQSKGLRQSNKLLNGTKKSKQNKFFQQSNINIFIPNTRGSSNPEQFTFVKNKPQKQISGQIQHRPSPIHSYPNVVKASEEMQQEQKALQVIQKPVIKQTKSELIQSWEQRQEKEQENKKGEEKIKKKIEEKSEEKIDEKRDEKRYEKIGVKEEGNEVEQKGEKGEEKGERQGKEWGNKKGDENGEQDEEDKGQKKEQKLQLQQKRQQQYRQQQQNKQSDYSTHFQKMLKIFDQHCHFSQQKETNFQSDIRKTKKSSIIQEPIKPQSHLQHQLQSIPLYPIRIQPISLEQLRYLRATCNLSNCQKSHIKQLVQNSRYSIQASCSKESNIPRSTINVRNSNNKLRNIRQSYSHSSEGQRNSSGIYSCHMFDFKKYGDMFSRFYMMIARTDHQSPPVVPIVQSASNFRGNK